MIIQFLINTFHINTKGSFRKTYLVSTDHYVKLKARELNPRIEAILAVYDPLYQTYKTKYIELTMSRGESKALTYEVDQLLYQLGHTKIQEWWNAIKKYFPEDTIQFRTLFPNGTKPFRIGKRDLRLGTLSAFRNEMMSISALSEIFDEVDGFNSLITRKLDDQRLKLEMQKQYSDSLEGQHNAVCEALYSNLGLLMDIFKSNPLEIENFFNFGLLRKKVSENVPTYTGFINGAQTVNILNKEFNEIASVILQNPGDTELNFCLAPEAGTFCHDAGIIVGPKRKKTVLVSKLGDLRNRYLNVTNLHAFNEGQYSLSDLG